MIDANSFHQVINAYNIFNFQNACFLTNVYEMVDSDLRINPNVEHACIAFFLCSYSRLLVGFLAVVEGNDKCV